MKKIGSIIILLFVTVLVACNSEKSKTIAESGDLNYTEKESDTLTKTHKSVQIGVAHHRTFDV